MKIFKLLGMLLSFAVLYSAVCIFISTRFIDGNVSALVSYLAGAVLTLINIYFLNYILNGSFLIIVYVVFNIVLSLVLVSVSRKTSLFYA